MFISNNTEINRDDLYEAASEGRFAKLKKFLGNVKDVNTIKDIAGNNLLHYAAAIEGNEEMIRFLASRGVVAIAKNNRGDSPRDVAYAGSDGRIHSRNDKILYLLEKLESTKILSFLRLFSKK